MDKPDQWTKEEKDRVVGFFNLLLKIDQRVNPENYKNNSAQGGSGQDSQNKLK